MIYHHIYTTSFKQANGVTTQLSYTLYIYKWIEYVSLHLDTHLGIMHHVYIYTYIHTYQTNP